MLFISYSVHYWSHTATNFWNILHHYHHAHNNFFSYISQIFLELNFISITYFLNCIFNYIYNTVFFDEWIVLFSVMFYSSVHNINYGIFHVNDVHSLHHKNVQTNIGPDICDVIFNTKHKKNKFAENTNHYIPNLIIILFITLFLKYNHNKNINTIFFYIFSFIFLFCLLSSVYLYIFNFHLL